MFVRTVSVPQAIKEILASNNLYLQALASGIANYTALAQRIKPDVEKLTSSNVNIGTIVVGIKRLVDSLGKDPESESYIDQFATPVFEGVRMSLTGGVMDVDFNESKLGQLSYIFDQLLETESNHKYNLFQTDMQIRLLVDDVKEIRDIVSAASKKFNGRIKDRLSKITISVPPILDERDNTISYHNFISSVSEIVHNSRIQVQDAFFTPNEIVLIFNDKDAARAYELLRARITKP
jgi:hypothetical protein